MYEVIPSPHDYLECFEEIFEISRATIRLFLSLGIQTDLPDPCISSNKSVKSLMHALKTS